MVTPIERRRFKSQRKKRLDRLKDHIAAAEKLEGAERTVAVEHIKRHFQHKEECEIFAQSGL